MPFPEHGKRYKLVQVYAGGTDELIEQERIPVLFCRPICP